jgi:hypothetical protein
MQITYNKKKQKENYQSMLILLLDLCIMWMWAVLLTFWSYMLHPFSNSEGWENVHVYILSILWHVSWKPEMWSQQTAVAREWLCKHVSTATESHIHHNRHKHNNTVTVGSCVICWVHPEAVSLDPIRRATSQRGQKPLNTEVEESLRGST